MTADVHALTGAYVLDAVTGEERLEFERHLRECETCAREVDELRETATRLGRAAAAVPPPRLKGAVLNRIRQVRQDPPEAAVPPRWRRTSWTTRLTSAAAAVLLVAAGVLGVLLVRSERATDDARARTAAISSILEAGDARVLNQRARDGGALTLLSSRSADRALVLTENLPELEPDQDYQAWTIGDRVRSAGLIPEDDTTFTVHDIAAAGSIGITVEPAGGSERPTLPDLIVNFELS